MITIADTIRTARKQAGLTQQQLSTHYSIPARTLCDWETSKRTPPEYLVTLLLRCMTLDFPMAVESLSEEPKPASLPIETEQEQLAPKPVKKTDYVFCNTYGKPLASDLAELALREFVAGRVQKVEEVDEEEEPIENVRGTLFICTAPDFERGVPFGFEFRVRLVEEL